MTPKNHAKIQFRLTPDLRDRFKLSVDRSKYRSAQHWFEESVKRFVKTDEINAQYERQEANRKKQMGLEKAND